MAKTSNARHIALLSRGWRGGGVQQMMRHVADELLARGFRVDLLIRGKAPKDAQRQGFRVIPLRRWPRSVGRYMAWRADPEGLSALLRPVLLTPLAAEPLGLMPALTRYLRNERPDALIAATTYMNLAAIWSRRLSGASTRILVSERDNLSQNLKTGKSRHAWRWRHAPALLARTYPFADAVSAVSKGVRDDLRALTGLEEDKLKTIYNPVMARDLADRTTVLPDDPWFAPGAPPVVLSAGRLVAKKNFSTLLQGVKRSQESLPLRLMILGDGPERGALERQARQLGIEDSVRLPGWVEDVHGYMASAAVFALTSNREGFGNVLVEALAAGCPVVSTDCPSGPSEILADGDYGRLIPIGDVDALAAGLIEAVTSPPDKAALRRRASSFTAASAVDGYLDALGLAREPAPPR